MTLDELVHRYDESVDWYFGTYRLHGQVGCLEVTRTWQQGHEVHRRVSLHVGCGGPKRLLVHDGVLDRLELKQPNGRFAPVHEVLA